MIDSIRKAKISFKRIKGKKNPFKFRPKSSKRKHLNLAKRHAKEIRFRIYGMVSILISVSFLGFLLFSIIYHGYSALQKTEIRLTVNISEDLIDADNIAGSNFRKIKNNSLKLMFPEVRSRKDVFSLYSLISGDGASEIREFVIKNPEVIGKSQELWLTASSDVDMFMKGKIDRNIEENRRKIKDKQIIWIDYLQIQGRVQTSFNTIFFTEGDSREPEQAGVLGSIIGSVFTILVCMLVSLPLGVGAAIYLEEFAPKNRFTDIIEVNINNLAAVPSIIFGLLALAVYLNFFGMPRSSSLVGGFALAFLVLPTIVITTRNALKAVPPSIRYAATALGATKMQVVMHHTVPYAMPGIMTGTILSVARALGETAPLLMIGMVAFVADIPSNFTDPATTLPVQVYLWADSPELGFAEKTSACIIILLLFLIFANAWAVYLRKKFEYRW